MRDSNTVDGLRLKQTIVNFEDNLTSLGFTKPPNIEFGQIDANLIKNFLENKITQQNQEYSRKAEDDRERSGGYGSAFAKPSTFYRPINDDTKSQIENLLDHAIQNEGKGSFESRNASALNITGSLIKKALSLTAISFGGSHQNQKNSLQKSKSLPTQNEGQKDTKEQSKGGHINLKMPTQKNKPTNRKKTLGKRISDVWSRITFKKTKQQNIGSSRGLAKPNIVDPQSNRNTSSLSRNSSFNSSRIGATSKNPQLSNRSQSFNGELRSQQSIASRNQNLSRGRSMNSQASLSSQGSFVSRSSRDSNASKVNQSRNGGTNNNSWGR